jgi:hypothetical protein
MGQPRDGDDKKWEMETAVAGTTYPATVARSQKAADAFEEEGGTAIAASDYEAHIQQSREDGVVDLAGDTLRSAPARAGTEPLGSAAVLRAPATQPRKTRIWGSATPYPPASAVSMPEGTPAPVLVVSGPRASTPEILPPTPQPAPIPAPGMPTSDTCEPALALAEPPVAMTTSSPSPRGYARWIASSALVVIALAVGSYFLVMNSTSASSQEPTSTAQSNQPSSSAVAVPTTPPATPSHAELQPLSRVEAKTEEPTRVTEPAAHALEPERAPQAPHASSEKVETVAAPKPAPAPSNSTAVELKRPAPTASPPPGRPRLKPSEPPAAAPCHGLECI